jgi:cytochrome c550
MMNRNPVIPYILIFVFGIGLMFLLSFKGLGDMDELAKEKEGGTETEQVARGPEEIYNSCIGCHGDQYQGGMGPALTGVGDRLSQDEIKEIVVNGKGAMPGGMVKPEEADAMAEWLANIK